MSNSVKYGQGKGQGSPIFSYELKGDLADNVGESVKIVHFFRHLKARDMAEARDQSENPVEQTAYMIAQIAHLPLDAVLDLRMDDYQALNDQLGEYL